MKEIDSLQKIIDTSRSIVFFSGAGISTLSGLKDFRGENGLYKMRFKYKAEKILSHNFYVNNKREFYNFYRQYFKIDKIKPNIVHEYLVQLEHRKKLKAIVTQNIDNLHTLAGSKRVFELHGNVTRNYCSTCHKKYGYDAVFGTDTIPVCKCGGYIKPDVVLYGEQLDYKTLDKAIKAISKCDTLIVAGTSLSVFPASGLIRYFKGRNLVIINKDITKFDKMATLVINDDLGKVFSKLK